MKLVFKVDRRPSQVAAGQEARHRKAATQALARATHDVKDSLRRQTESAGLGRKLAMAWRAAVYPNKGASFRAAGEVWSKAPEIMESHALGATIRPKGGGGKYLALPTAAAPRGRGGARIGPADWPEKRFGPLAFVTRGGGKAPLLVARGVRVTKAGRIAKAAERKATKTMGAGTLLAGLASVPVFVLVKRVKVPRKLSMDQARRLGRSRVATYFRKMLQKS